MKTSKITVCLIGLGYVGIPTAVALAKNGSKVVGFDTSENRVKAINAGSLPIEEPNLEVPLKLSLIHI